MSCARTHARVCAHARAPTFIGAHGPKIEVPRTTTFGHLGTAPEQYMLNLLGETRQFWPVHNRPCTHGVTDSAPRTRCADLEMPVRGPRRVRTRVRTRRHVAGDRTHPDMTMCTPMAGT